MITRTRNIRVSPLLAGLSITLVAGLVTGAASMPNHDFCRDAANAALQSCRREAATDFWLARSKCANISDSTDRYYCVLDALHEYADERDLCWERNLARQVLCGSFGPDAYEPEIDPDNFVRFIDNPYLSWLPGTTFVYEKDGEEGFERIETEVTDETVEIMGVTCTVIHDVGYLDGEVAEDTFDWYAQDVDGNVWYFGELSRDFEDGVIVGLDGSWKAGEDGAHAGIIMPAAPAVGDLYRQEYLIREAEDIGGVLSLTATVVLESQTYTNCLQTEDYTPIEPDTLEQKFYAPGVGLVLELDVESGERTELVEILMR